MTSPKGVKSPEYYEAAEQRELKQAEIDEKNAEDILAGEKVIDPWGGRRCKAVNNRGLPCRSYSIGGDDYCSFHGLAPEDFRDLQAKGGYASKKWFKRDDLLGEKEFVDELNALPLETADDIKHYLGKVTAGIANEKISKDKALQLIAAANVILTALRTTAALIPKESRPKDDVVVPEIKEIKHSTDPRVTASEYPGSEFGSEEKAVKPN